MEAAQRPPLFVGGGVALLRQLVAGVGGQISRKRVKDLQSSADIGPGCALSHQFEGWVVRTRRDDDEVDSTFIFPGLGHADLLHS